MRSNEEYADESSNGPVRPLKNCPFCGGYWEVVPISQTYRYFLEELTLEATLAVIETPLS